MSSAGERSSHLPEVMKSPLGRAVLIVLVGCLISFVIVPQLSGAGSAWHRISELNPWMIVLATVLELVAWALYALMIWSLIPRETRPSFSLVVGTAIASKGVSHVVPAGSATVVAVDYKMLKQAGVHAEQVGFALGGASIGSAAVLNVLLWISLALSMPRTGVSWVEILALLIGALLFAAVGLTVRALLGSTDRTAAKIGRTLGKLPHVEASSVRRGVVVWAGRIRQLIADRRRLGRQILAATLNWSLGATALWVVLVALGGKTAYFGVFVAYALANVASVVPLTPGGLGIYEAAMIPTLVAFDTPHRVAAAAVVTFRLINFWLPIPLGGICYVWVDRATSVSPPNLAEDLRQKWKSSRRPAAE